MDVSLILNTTTLLEDNVTLDDFTLSNQTLEFNRSLTSYGYRMYFLPTLPGWVSTLYLVMLCLTIGLGIPGNLITALAYFFIKTKTSCDWYIFFVALFDLISCVFRVTGYLLEFLGLWVKLTNSAYCMFVGWLSQTSVCVSIFIFGLISVERYIKICSVASYNITATRSKNICLALAAVTFVMGFPTVFMYGNTSNGLCTVSVNVTQRTWVKAYYCIVVALFIALTIAVMVCYIAIAWTVRKRRKTVGVFPDSNMTYAASFRRTPASGLSTSGKRLSRNLSTGADTSEEMSSPYWVVPGSCSNGTRCPDASRQAVSRLFIVPGPQTRVIVQQVNTTPCRNGKSPQNETNSPGKNGGDESGGRTGLKPPSPPPPPSPPTPVTDSQPNSGNNHNNMSMLSQFQYARRQRRDFKITGLLFLVTSIFIVSWIPPYYATVKAFFIGYTFPLTMREHITLKLAPTCYVINNFSNPIIYLALSSTYRQKVKNLWTTFVRFLKRPCL